MTIAANTSLGAMLSKKRLIPWLLNYDSFEKASAKGLKIRIITEDSAKLPKPTLSMMRKYDVEIRY